MKYNTKIKTIFASLMIILTGIGMYGIILMTKTMNPDGNIFMFGLLGVPIVKFIGLSFLDYDAYAKEDLGVKK